MLSLASERVVLATEKVKSQTLMVAFSNVTVNTVTLAITFLAALKIEESGILYSTRMATNLRFKKKKKGTRHIYTIY